MERERDKYIIAIKKERKKESDDVPRVMMTGGSQMEMGPRGHSYYLSSSAYCFRCGQVLSLCPSADP